MRHLEPGVCLHPALGEHEVQAWLPSASRSCGHESSPAGSAKAVGVQVRAALWCPGDCLPAVLDVRVRLSPCPVSGHHAHLRQAPLCSRLCESTLTTRTFCLCSFSPRVTFLPTWTEDQPRSRESRESTLRSLSTITTHGMTMRTRTPTGRWVPVPCPASLEKPRVGDGLWEELFPLVCP